MSKLLLHTCCAPCSIKCIETLKKDGIDPDLFWYNPNIHPFTEYRSRKNALIEYSKLIDANLILKDDYGLRPFVCAVSKDIAGRCSYCYEIRLDAVSRYAAQNGYDGFSTTLLISPYQNHDLIKQIAKAAAKKHGVNFIYKDFRPYFREGQQAARDIGLYMQKYCGCIFSEEERYMKKKK